MNKILLYATIVSLIALAFINVEASVMSEQCKVTAKVSNKVISDNSYIIIVKSTSTPDLSHRPDCPFFIGDTYKIKTSSSDPIDSYLIGNTLTFSYQINYSAYPLGTSVNTYDSSKILALDIDLNSSIKTVYKYEFIFSKYTVSNPSPREFIDDNNINPGDDVLNKRYGFMKNVGIGSRGVDVKELQSFLNRTGYLVSNIGPGSLGKETDYFGLATKRALARFQKDNNIEGTGYLGPITRKLINSI
jgi:hypothetical protein